MDIQSKLEIIKSQPTEEIVTEQDLIQILETKTKPVHYFGLEISGMPHIGHILCAGKKINDLAKIGFETNILLADWHTVANQKLGGDWEKIKKASEFYKKLFSIACPSSRITLGSDLYNNNNEYWKEVMKIATKTTMARATRTLIIQGRSEKDTLYVSQYIYPIMQVADIRAFGADVAHAGMDQRKVHMLAREVFKDLNDKKPLALMHTHLIQSLLEPPKVQESADKEEIVTAMKMSKSKPGSSIPILSDEKEVRKIISGGWCPEGIINENPILGLCKYIIMPTLGKLKIERPEKYGGNLEFESYSLLEKEFENKKIHPADLKNAVSNSLIKIMEPITKAFSDKKDEIQLLFR
ncbi:MAG: tyrosine--tRNA ligase [Candidatus Micrarchaeaceae archaeon]